MKARKCYLVLNLWKKGHFHLIINWHRMRTQYPFSKPNALLSTNQETKLYKDTGS